MCCADKKEELPANLPQQIRERIAEKPYTVDQVGMSGSYIACFADSVLKVERQGEESDNEQRMMAWLKGRLPVPDILCAVSQDGYHYLLMSRVEGEMACCDRLLAQPERLVRLLAQGLRRLWRVPTADCPSNNDLNAKLCMAEQRVADGLCSTEDAEPGTYGPGSFSSPKELLAWLKGNRPNQQLVFTHGDYCLPNLFVKGERISGFIDLGRSGLADPYQDIALCYRSLLYNLTQAGQDWHRYVSLFFQELELTPDWEKIRYYILLDELF